MGKHYKATTNIWSRFEQNPRNAGYSCIYKGISEKYKGKINIKQFLLSFLAGRSNQLLVFTRLLHFYSFFRRHPYCRRLRPYGHMVIWPYGHMAVWPYSHMAIWLQRWPKWLFMETAIQIQQSGVD